MTTSADSLARSINLDAVIAGQARLSVAQALRLYHEAPLSDLGRWASAVAQRKMAEAYPDRHAQPDAPGVRTYVIDRNINYTNVCSAHCTFCAFKRDLGEQDAYTLSTRQLHEKVRELVEIGGTQILLQGGMHPELPIEFYEEMLRRLKAEFPLVHIHGFSPPEVVEFVAVFQFEGFSAPGPGRGDQLPPDVWHAKLERILSRLMDAGLDSIPGGGAEIFAPHVRRRIGLGKASAEQWLAVMHCAHRLGMFTSATMMFGHIEGVADRLDHLQRVRDAQDLALQNHWPGRYVSFISWPFQRQNTPLGRLKDWDGPENQPFPGDVAAEGGHHELAGKRLRLAGASEYLRMQAISRLFLDNIHSVGSSWVTMGPHIGQLGLFFGANDMGSVMMEENVVSAAGTTYRLTEPLICHLIRSAGFLPAQRDNRYRLIKVHDGSDAPDHQVRDWSALRGGGAPTDAEGAGLSLPVVGSAD